MKSIVRGSIVSLFAFTLAVSASQASAQSIITGTDPQPTSPNGPSGPKSSTVTTTPSTGDVLSLLLSVLVS